MRSLPIVSLAVLAATVPASSRVLVTQDEALALAFPAPATIQRREFFLTDTQLGAARDAAGAGTTIDSAHVVRYEGWRDGALLGVAYVDVDRIRTLRASVLFVIRPGANGGAATIVRVEILSWGEPPDYLPRPGWTEQLQDRPLSSELSLKQAVRPITGATLTSQALTMMARRVLALHGVLPAPEPPR